MKELICETMNSFNEYMDTVVHYSVIIAEKLRDNDVKSALKEIINFSEGVEWAHTVQQNLEKIGYFNNLEVEKLNEFLEEINTSLEIQDYMSTADIFEYEIKTYFEQIQKYNLNLVKLKEVNDGYLKK